MEANQIIIAVITSIILCIDCSKKKKNKKIEFQ